MEPMHRMTALASQLCIRSTSLYSTWLSGSVSNYKSLIRTLTSFGLQVKIPLPPRPITALSSQSKFLAQRSLSTETVLKPGQPTSIHLCALGSTQRIRTETLHYCQQLYVSKHSLTCTTRTHNSHFWFIFECEMPNSSQPFLKWIQPQPTLRKHYQI